jgi:osmotically inducible protein OsmC
MKRNATAVWNGSIKRRSREINNTKYDLENTQYSWLCFETGVGTNPEN